MGVIIGAREETLPGIDVVSWLQDRDLRLAAEDRRPRRGGGGIHSIVLHTTKGIPGGTNLTPQTIRPGFGPSTDAGARTARFWSHDGRGAGAHLIVDQDGTVYCCADLLTEAAYHAGPINEWSIGIEIFQGADGSLYAGALEKVLLLDDALTLRFGIQRQIPQVYRNQPSRRLMRDPGGWVGILGHRDVSDNRGRGDPGDAVMQLHAAAGYEAYDPDKLEDFEAWKLRQAQLGVHADGIPGPQTRQALMRASLGRNNGLWVVRPVDSLASSPPA